MVFTLGAKTVSFSSFCPLQAKNRLRDTLNSVCNWTTKGQMDIHFIANGQKDIHSPIRLISNALLYTTLRT